VRKKKVFLILTLLAIVAVFCGCQGVKFYSQAVGGPLEIFQKQKPIRTVLAQPDTQPKLKQKLELVLDLRQFAAKELHLDPDQHYLRYADLGREHVVWNVHAAPEFSMEPKSWWYPFVGNAKYRGFFTEKAAREYGEKLRKENLDVYVEGVDAYSTLGWFKDPVLNTFIYDRDSALAETIFHELAHQRVFISGDTDFNEAFATAVGEEGVRRWLKAHDDPETRKKYLSSRHRKEQFVELVLGARKELKAIYAQEIPDAEKRVAKERALEKLRANYQKLKAEWGGYPGYDHWFSGPLNNAQLNTVATYYTLVPAFEKLLTENGGDLEKFYAAVERLGKLDTAERREKLFAQ
jgi:predicted aminopeptidase